MEKRLLTLILLLVFVHSFAQQTNHWTTIIGTQYNLTMSGLISIDNVAQTSTFLEIGAFCGTECRGSARAQLFPPTGEYVVCLAVVSNQQNGETITFRLYDHANQQEYPSECVNSIIFNANDNLGTMGDWYPFTFVSSQTQTVNLSAGWNWWAPTVATNIETVEQALGDALVDIQSKQGSASGEAIAGDMYRIQTNAACTLSLSGMPMGTATVALQAGSNWFGYTGDEEKAIAEAVSVEATTGDKIVSQNGGFAIYNGTAWQGTLTTLQPGQGYVYVSQSNETKTLVME